MSPRTQGVVITAEQARRLQAYVYRISEEVGDCWISRLPNNGGTAWIRGVGFVLSRNQAAWLGWHRVLRPGAMIRTLCDRKGCINPRHLGLALTCVRVKFFGRRVPFILVFRAMGFTQTSGRCLRRAFCRLYGADALRRATLPRRGSSP